MRPRHYLDHVEGSDCIEAGCGLVQKQDAATAIRWSETSVAVMSIMSGSLSRHPHVALLTRPPPSRIKATPFWKVTVKFTVKNAVCNGLGRMYTAF